MRSTSAPVLALLSALLLGACSSGDGGSQKEGQVPTPASSPTAPQVELTSTPDPTVQAEIRAGELLAAAVSAYEENQNDRSVSLLLAAIDIAPDSSPAEEAARFLLGRRLLDSGNIDGALTHLEAAVAVGGVLRFHAGAALAEAREEAGDDAVAADLRATLLAESDLPAAVREAIVQAAAEAASPDDAAELADQANSPPALAAVLQAMAAGGSTTALVAVLNRLIDGFPSSEEALDALAIANQFGIQLEPGIVGRALYRNHELEAAIVVLLPTVSDPDATASTLALRTYYLATAIDDAGNPVASIQYYDLVRELVPGDQFAYRAGYWAARALEAIGDTEAATERYVALVEERPSGQFARDAAFRAGYAWLESGEPETALAAWESAVGGADARVFYWKARAHEQLGDIVSAEASLRAAAVEQLSFYGEEATRRLTGEPPPDAGYRPLPERPPPEWDDVETWFINRTGLAPPTWGFQTVAGLLSSLGLLTDGAEALKAAAAANPEPANVLALAREAAAAELAGTAIVLLRDALGDYPTSFTSLPSTLQSILYPLPLPDVLDAEAERNSIDPLLLAALVRQESLWDPAAISFAGAIGLTQVMPPTGEQIASEIGFGPFATRDLLKPSVSLRFGSYYIAAQLDRFGSPAAALAAYNGGPAAAAVWVAMADPVEDPARFLESISFQETYGYVELVLTGYARYRFLTPP